MRDGVVLRADVYRPESGDPVPAIVYRTPYDRSHSLIPSAGIDPERAVAAGFAVVCQDVRGQYGSDGEFRTFFSEGADGYDSVEWTAAQEWCDGSVAMAGRSYAASVQWLAAAERPPHLSAICPVVTGSDYYEGWTYQGGAFQLGFNLFWTQLMTSPRAARKLDELYQHLPLTDVAIDRESGPGRSYLDWLAHPTDDAFWRSLSVNRRYERIEVPALVVGGWYDIFLRGTLENYAGLRAEGGSEEARRESRLVVGPWAHGSTYGTYPDHSFSQFGGVDAVDLDELQLGWLGARLGPGARHAARSETDMSRCLAPSCRAQRRGSDVPPVRIFVMGENRWRDEDAWPLARAREQAWHLRAGGALTLEPPGDEPPDSYVYEPSDPAPTVGGPASLPGPMLRMNAGPLDQRRLEARADVLVYTSGPLTEPLEATGPLALVLWAATDAADADWVGKLTDVDLDGTSRILAEGILRARFREGYDQPRLVEPGLPAEYTVDLVATSHVFLPGHCIRVLVTSSSFPRFDRNTGSGKPLGTDTEGDLRAARQSVFHDSARPSRLLLPVVR